MTTRQRDPARSRLAVVPLALGLVLTAGACGSASPAPRVLGQVGPMQVTQAYVPAPASPSVAALYLTIRNTGTAPDELVGISTPAASSATLMTEAVTGGSESMQVLPVVYIPAHGEAMLTPGHDHAMLTNPSASLVRAGRSVQVTLHFSEAGSLTMAVPVVPLSAVVGGGGGMANMPGM